MKIKRKRKSIIRRKPPHSMIARTLTGVSTLLLMGSVATFSEPSWAGRDLSDAELRAAAPPRLTLDDVPDMQAFLDYYIKDKDAAIVLGKALFWDTQVGGDGVQACASCHFRAGADPRSINQLSPGLLDTTNPDGGDPGDQTFQAKGAGAGGPNYALGLGDFPFFDESPLGKFDNDVVSSMGVPLRTFIGFTTPSDPAGDCDSVDDLVFTKDSHNTRRVEPRNTPTVLNAVFNHRNFWDGRANNFFNGDNPLGLRGQLLDVNGPLPNIADPEDTTNRDPKKAVWEYKCDFSMFGFCWAGHLEPRWPLHQPGALASQAVGPPGSIFEMSCGNNRTFPDIGRHILQRRPLAFQTVHSNDSIFGAGGPMGNLVASNGLGLFLTYDQLVRQAFQNRWWAGIGLIPPDGDPGTNFSQIEDNFSAFFGVAVQLYEATLVTNQTPFDAFASLPDGTGGDNSAMTEDQKEGLEVFLSEEGRCILCHAGPEFTGATFAERAIQIGPDGEPVIDPISGIVEGEPMERMRMGNGLPAVYDGGFYNIGARATAEDLCVGGETAGVPISFSRQASVGPKIDPESRVDAVGDDLDPSVGPGPVLPGERVAVDGACKVPGLRMAADTAPYFHAGQVASLHEAVRLYKDQFEPLFSDENIDDLDPDILAVEITGFEDPGIEIGGGDVNRITTFIAEALTDPRVLDESAPFDHPELCVPNGHPEPITGKPVPRDIEATDAFICTEAVGAQGRVADGLPPLPDAFLNIDQANF